MKIIEYPADPETGHYLIEINGHIERAWTASCDTQYATYIDGLYLMCDKDLDAWNEWHEEQEVLSWIQAQPI